MGAEGEHLDSDRRLEEAFVTGQVCGACSVLAGMILALLFLFLSLWVISWFGVL